jgi:monoamine oxidase
VQYDVIVIGAGAAGLAAARDLSSAGRTVCIVEGRDRIGGRIFTLRPAGSVLPIELGAEFIHGNVESTLSIVDAAPLVTMRLPDNHWWSSRGRWQLRAKFWDEIGSIRSKIDPKAREVTFAEFLRNRRNLPPRVRMLATNFVEGYHAAHADRITARALQSSDKEQESNSLVPNPQFRIVSGYDRIPEWLLAGIDPSRSDLRLSTVARRVAWSRGRVAVEVTSRGTTSTLRAKALVVTIPIGVWKAPREQLGAIAFEPRIAPQRALARLEAGHVVKTIFRFREAFWSRDSFLLERARRADARRGFPINFVHSSGRNAQTWWTTAPIRSPILVAWSGGHAADSLLAESPDARIDRTLDALAAVFGVRRAMLDTLLASVHSHDWQADPFSRSAYSYAGIGGLEAQKQLARPVENTIFVAGEATSADQTGTVAGAIESGRRAAREVGASLAQRS